MRNMIKKGLLFIALILVTVQTVAQDRQVISLGADPKLAIVGAYENSDTPVLHIHFSWLTSFESGNEWGVRVSYANLQPYNYFDYGFLYNRRIRLFNNEQFETLVGARLGLIVRSYPEYDTQKAYFDYGVNAQMRFMLNDWFGFFIKGTLGPRNDLDYYGDHQAIHFENNIGVIVKF